MIKIKKSNVSEKMIEEVLKEDDLPFLFAARIGRKRHLKLLKYLLIYKDNMPQKNWICQIIDELPD